MEKTLLQELSEKLNTLNDLKESAYASMLNINSIKNAEIEEKLKELQRIKNILDAHTKVNTNPKEAKKEVSKFNIKADKYFVLRLLISVVMAVATLFIIAPAIVTTSFLISIGVIVAGYGSLFFATFWSSKMSYIIENPEESKNIYRLKEALKLTKEKLEEKILNLSNKKKSTEEDIDKLKEIIKSAEEKYIEIRNFVYQVNSKLSQANSVDDKLSLSDDVESVLSRFLGL